MSFIQTPSKTSYFPDKNIDTSIFPSNYLSSFYHLDRNNNGIQTFMEPSHPTFKDKHNNEVQRIPLVQPWYQPGGFENLVLLNHFNVTNNQQYRAYMTKQSLDVRKYNEKSFVKTIK